MVQEIWFRGSDPTDDFAGVLMAPGGTKDKVLLGNLRSCHGCGCPSHHLPDTLSTLGFVELGPQTIDLL